MFEIINTSNEDDINEDFLAIGCLVNDKQEPYHVALIIKHDSILYQYHYTGREIDWDLIDDAYFHKKTKTVRKEEIPAFIAYCKRIKVNANPIYGYFYSGEYYNRNGVHFSTNQIGERMTCVGFCLNVLTGFLENDYLNYTDWDASNIDNNYLIAYAVEHSLIIDNIQDSHRRIMPIELFTSGFFNIIPISKITIDNKLNDITDYFANLKNY